MSLPSFIFGGNTGVSSPEELARLRMMADALSAPRAPKNIGEGLSALGDALGYRMTMNKANKMQAEGNASASSAIMAALGGAAAGPFPAAPGGGASPIAAALSKPSDPNLPSSMDFAQAQAAPSAPAAGGGDIEAYIRQAAAARGIDPDVAVTVAKSEGGLKDPVRRSDYSKGGNREPSYGPFQLLVGGDGTGFPEGMGNAALKAGIDPRDPANAYRGIDFALDQAKSNGWGAWYGAKASGITGMHGIGQAPAAAPQQVASLDPSVGMPPPASPNPVAAALQLPAQGPIPQGRPDVAAALNGAPAAPPLQPGVDVGAPGAATPAGQRVLSQMMSPQPMGGAPIPMQPAGGQHAAPVPPQAIPSSPQVAASAPAPAGPAQPGDANLPVMAGGNSDAIAPGGHAPTMQQLIALASNPWAMQRYGPVIQSLIAQQMKLTDPAYALDLADKRVQLQLHQQQVGGAFRGDGMDAQAWNILQTRDPASKEYATAYAYVSQPKNQLVAGPSGQQLVAIPPVLPGWLKAPIGDAADPQPAGPGGTSPASGAPAAPAAPGASTTSGAAPGTGVTVGAVIPGTRQMPTETQGRNGAITKILLGEAPTIGANFKELSSTKGQILNALPYGVGNWFQSEGYQKAATAIGASVSNILYSLSGASSNPDEVKKQIQYLTPVPGDQPGQVADKLQRFKTYVRAIASEANDPELLKSVDAAISQMGDPTQPTGSDKAPAAGGAGTTSKGLKWSIEP